MPGIFSVSVRGGGGEGGCGRRLVSSDEEDLKSWYINQGTQIMVNQCKFSASSQSKTILQFFSEDVFQVNVACAVLFSNLFFD